ncbi:MAG: hypothetical protein A2V88_02180 [Elusimicrobia bacterium RBG_16_66_12]|nr:MAG: hypothetical protein A2V88_02180 [Elusimicrobia bacterium RBG_16_66_12]
MSDPQPVSRSPQRERIYGEVNSKCASLRAASRLLPDLSRQESDEMLLLMTEEALRLAKSIKKYRQGARQG